MESINDLISFKVPKQKTRSIIIRRDKYLPLSEKLTSQKYSGFIYSPGSIVLYNFFDKDTKKNEINFPLSSFIAQRLNGS
jgi:hypothetical protein